MPGPPGTHGEPMGTLWWPSLASGDLPPVQAAITVACILGAPMAAAGVDSRAG